MINILVHRSWIVIFWVVASVFLLTPDPKASDFREPTVWDEVVTAVTGEDEWTVITEDKSLTERAREIAEELVPGVTDRVLIKVGDLDTEDCSCGGWWTVMEVDGVEQPVIVISEEGFQYDTHWGYHTVAHEVAHHLNYEENGYNVGGHDDRFKHWYQEITPREYWHFEEGYDYGDGESRFRPEYDY